MPAMLVLAACGREARVEEREGRGLSTGWARKDGSIALLDLASGTTRELLHYQHGLVMAQYCPVTDSYYVLENASSGLRQKPSAELRIMRLE